MGQANEKVARVQDSYVQAAGESWMESLERSLAQMKEYQVCSTTRIGRVWKVLRRHVTDVTAGS